MESVRKEKNLSHKKTKKLPKPSLFLLLLLTIIFVILNTIFLPAGMPTIPLMIGGARLFIQDTLFLLLMVSSVFYKLNNHPLAISSPISKYLVVFIGVVLFESLYSIAGLGHPVFTVYNDVKTILYYLLFFPVIWCFGSEKGVDRIIKLWVGLAIFGAVFYIYQFIFGELAIFDKYDWLYSHSLNVETGGTSSVKVDFQRLIMQGTVIFRIMLFVAFCMWLFNKGASRKWWGVLAFLLAVQVALQFTRGMYMTTFMALLVMPFIVRDTLVRRKIIAVFLYAAIVIGFVVIYKAVFSSGSSGSYSLIEFIGERLLNAVTQSSSDSSIEGRMQGASYIFQLIDNRGSWIYGLGFGTGIVYGDSTYVSILMKMGWVGMTAFLLLMIRSLWHAFRNYRYLVEPKQKALVMALMVSTGRHLVNGLTQSDFVDNTRVPALIVSIAIIEIIIFRAKEQRKLA